MPPGLIVALLLILIESQLIYALVPQRRARRYVSVLALTAAGWVGGQLWLGLGWPAWRIGQADVFPAFGFALLLQPLAPYLPNLPRFGAGSEGN